MTTPRDPVGPRGRRLLVPACAGALLVAACGGTEPTDAPEPGETWARLLQLYCEDAHRCADDGESAYDPFRHGESVSECVELWHRWIGTPAEISTSVEAGRIDLDDDVVDLCLTLREGIACGEYWHTTASEDPTCGLLTGTVPVGGACTINADCVGGFPECFNGECVDHDADASD
jgi:hypothetical protein